MCTEEGIGYTSRGAKVFLVWWVKWQGGMYIATVGIAAVGIDAAEGEKGPSRRIRCAGDAVCGGLEEVDLVLGVASNSAREDNEELEEDGTSNQNPAGEGE